MRPPHDVFASLFDARACQDASTPLMFAAQGGHADAVAFLLDAGADRLAQVRL